MANKRYYWYLSFVDDEVPGPRGEGQFLGACVVPVEGESSDISEAARIAWKLGINPGGQAMGWGPIPEDMLEFPPEYREVLMTEVTLRELFGGRSLRELNENEAEVDRVWAW